MTSHWRTSGPLRDLRHLKPRFESPHHIALNQRHGPKPKWVAPKDRVKWWNITAGDKVRLITGKAEYKKKDKLEVIQVERDMNRLYLKDGPTHMKGMPYFGDPDSPRYSEIAAPVHYSNVQLWVGDFEFPPLPGETQNRIIPVYATRVSHTAPRYSRAIGRFVWTRYAAATHPPLPPNYDKRGNLIKVEIPWPKFEPREIPEPGPLDTLEEEVLKVTWVPPHPSQNPGLRKSDELSMEDRYLAAPDPSDPIEHFVHREFSNPLSRANRTKRWQQRPLERKVKLARWIRRETRESAEQQDGRTPNEIRLEAQWKFEQSEIQKGKRRKSQRRELSGVTARIERKVRKRASKKSKAAKRAHNVVLKPAKNQVIPKSAGAA